MENNKSTLESILTVVGLLSLVIIVVRAYKSLSLNTETNVITEDALKAIQDPDTAEKLREAVDEYHDTGDWNKTKLESIL
jgi:hypothetical protein